MASLTPQLGDGKTGSYVSEKFPFAYDYADDDADASPAGSHGTHVAGIAAGNAGEIMGVAPDAQIIVARSNATAAVSRTPRCYPPWMTWRSCAPMS